MTISPNMPPLFTSALMRMLPRLQKTLYIFAGSNIKHCHPKEFLCGISVRPDRRFIHLEKSECSEIVDPHREGTSFKGDPESLALSH